MVALETDKSYGSVDLAMGIRKTDSAAPARRSEKDGGLGRALGCVTALVDDLRKLFVNMPAKAQLVVIQKHQDVEIFFARKPGKFERVAVFPASARANDLAKISRRLGRVPADKTVLRIASDRAIRKVISLPSSALSYLPSIVRNKVESISPWQSADMLWGYRLIDASAASDSIAIEIGMTGSEPVKMLASGLKVAGINVGRIEFGDSAGLGDHISVFSAMPVRSERKSRSVLVAAGALGAFAIVAGLAGGLQAWTAQKELRSTGAELQKLQALLDDRSAADGQTTAVSTAVALAARKQEDVPLIVILKELTQLIPDGTWLQSINFSDGRLTINGKGGPVSQVISALENSPFLQDVNFAAATQRDTADNQDSFSISATISPAKGEK
jgi:general secretion pathway protein L